MKKRKMMLYHQKHGNRRLQKKSTLVKNPLKAPVLTRLLDRLVFGAEAVCGG